MDIEYKGGNCVVLTTKKAKIAVDPKLVDLGLKDQADKITAQLITEKGFAVDNGLTIDGPGEYEVSNVSIRGIAALSHRDPKGSALNSSIYTIETEDIRVAVLGNIHPDLSEEQLESIGVIDVLIVPVGGNGYTLDATGASKVIRAIDPKVVIPTHYADSAVKYPVPQAELDLFNKELSASIEECNKLKLKAGSFPENLTVYKVKRTS